MNSSMKIIMKIDGQITREIKLTKTGMIKQKNIVESII